MGTFAPNLDGIGEARPTLLAGRSAECNGREARKRLRSSSLNGVLNLVLGESAQDYPREKKVDESPPQHSRCSDELRRCRLA
jgi:hypothetical protein